MNNQLPDIDALLDHIYAQEEPISQDENQPRRTINVYIDVEEEAQELPPTVESSLNGQTIPMPQPDETETPTTNEQSSDFLPFQSSRRLPMRRTRFVMLVLSLVAVLGLLIGGGYNFVLPLFAPSATITLVTTSQHLTTTSTVQLVTSGTADPTKQQVPGRALPAMTMSQQKTEATTGTAHQDAKVGRGIITFYNGATFTQTILAGTALTGADGVQLVTDADAIIPPAAFPTFGQRTVAAHAATTGPGGNVRAGDVYGACCRLNVFAVSGAFTGGQNARTYQTITSQDIDRVVTSITTSLEQSVQAALQTQVQPTETLVPPLDCTQKVTPDHEPGEEASTVTVTMDETCVGSVYQTQAFTTMTMQNATQDATKKLGTGYFPTGVQTSITQATRKGHGVVDLHVKSNDVWAYQYGSEQEQSIKAMIAGMSKDKAKTTLLHLTGIQSASLTTTNSATIPTDTTHIHVLFVQV